MNGQSALTLLALAVVASIEASTRGTVTEITTPQSRVDTVAIVQIDSVKVRKSAEQMVVKFITQWRERWKDSNAEWFKDPNFARYRDVRAGYLHCHPQTAANATSARPDSFPSKISPNYAPIVSTSGGFAKCPTWILGSRFSSVDEADSVDVALLPRFLPAIVSARSSLVAHLDSAQRALPGDGWIAGQRVRFRIDAGDFAGAIASATHCNADRWWCAALAGYVHHRTGDWAQADSAFGVATSLLNDKQRCEWTDISSLLPDNDRRNVQKLNCEQKLIIATRYFWLADPLLSDSVNERRVEHFARKTLIALHAATEEDERHVFDERRGGDAVVESLLRYGWPTTAIWTGKADDSGHDVYLGKRGKRASPYSTAEYSPGRVRFGASWRAVNNPSGAKPEDWQLHSPNGMWSERDSGNDVWWPPEHMEFFGRVIAQLPTVGQVGFWRRQTFLRTAAAMDLSGNLHGDLQQLHAQALSATLVTSSSERSTEIVAHAQMRLGEPLLLEGVIQMAPAAAPSIMGIEASTNPNIRQSATSARTRFGISPPLPLVNLQKDSLAISDPTLFAVRPNENLPVNLDQMLPRMLTSTTISTGNTVGIFWECYGATAEDSLRMSVNIVGANGVGFLRRLAASVKLASDPTNNISLSWKDLLSTEQSNKAPNAVSIVPRSVVLDLTNVRSGDYWIEVSVQSRSGVAAMARRLVTIKSP